MSHRPAEDQRRLTTSAAASCQLHAHQMPSTQHIQSSSSSPPSHLVRRHQPHHVGVRLQVADQAVPLGLVHLAWGCGTGEQYMQTGAS